MLFALVGLAILFLLSLSGLLAAAETAMTKIATSVCRRTPAVLRKTPIEMVAAFRIMTVISQKYIESLNPRYTKPYLKRTSCQLSFFRMPRSAPRITDCLWVMRS